MFLGVPYVPFFLVAGGLLLLSMYIDMRLLITIPIAIFILRHMAKRAEMIGLRLQFKFRARNLQQHDGMWVFTPNHYRDKPPPSD